MESETKSENKAQDVSDKDNKEQAFTHLAQGKRHLLVKDYSEAVTSLGLACQLLSQVYGEFANECGEAYFNYGIALLELARTENGVLGIEGEGEESQNSDDEEGEDEKEEGSVESETKHIENGEGAEKELDKEEETTETDSKTVDESSDVKDNDGESKEKSTEEDGDDNEDDVSNLHLAWEMLELAKLIFGRQAEGNKQMHLKLAEVHLKLGEVGLESENYSQAIEDMKTCLDIQLENLDKHDRCIAETHYQLGMAYSLLNEFDEAISQFTQAHELLQKRVEYLQERGKQGISNEEENKNNPFYTIEGEISEIKSLLPDVKEKIGDLEDCKKETKKALIEGFGCKKESGESSQSGQGTSAGSSGAFPVSSLSDAKPISDISHLVRKKRKLEPDSSEDKCSKLPCPEVSKLE